MADSLRKFFRSFGFAAEGIVYAVRHERNFRFHLCAAVTVMLLSSVYDLSKAEKCILILCIGSVLAAELFNTAVERAADLKGSTSPLAKAAKDCAAGGVLVCAAAAAVCGIVILYDRDIILFTVRKILSSPIYITGAVLYTFAALFFIFGTNTKK